MVNLPEIGAISSDPLKANLMLILITFTAILIAYDIYITKIDSSAYVCSLNEEGLSDLLLLYNLSLTIDDDNVGSINKGLNSTVKDILEDIFGETGIMCKYVCGASSTEDGGTTIDYTGDGFFLIPTCEGEGKACASDTDCCLYLDCVNGVCISQCTKDGGECGEDEECCYDLTCENEECAVCDCSETDEGDDPESYGKTTGWWQITHKCEAKKDKCNSDNTQLTEYYCGADGYMKSATYSCTCENGACVSCEGDECIPPCGGDYASCESDTDCCDDHKCENVPGYGDICVPDCSGNQGPCDSNDDCCSGFLCEAGLCVLPCANLGESCEFFECCDEDNYCLYDIGLGYKTCQLPEAADATCAEVGEVCTEALHCCEGSCKEIMGPTGVCCAEDGDHCNTDTDCCDEDYKCIMDEDSGENICTYAPACADPGEVCGGAITCCSGDCIDGTCQEEEAVACADISEECTEALPCCTGTCKFAGPTGRCCADLGQDCEYYYDCCDEDALCTDDICQLPCSGAGESCVDNTDCCDESPWCIDGICKVCAEDGDLCGPPCCDDLVCASGEWFPATCLSCIPEGALCSDTPDSCCDDLVCDGTCKQPCAEDGESCEINSDCCNWCVDGICKACADENDPCTGAPCCGGLTCDSVEWLLYPICLEPCVGLGESCADHTDCCDATPWCVAGICLECAPGGTLVEYSPGICCDGFVWVHGSCIACSPLGAPCYTLPEDTCCEGSCTGGICT